MRNSLAISTDRKSFAIFDTSLASQPLPISRRGVLISVLGSDVCAANVTPELEDHIAELLKKIKPFYSFSTANPERNQLCVSYNEASNTVFVIGITDIDVGFAGPVKVPEASTTVFGAKLKEKPGGALAGSQVILARLEGSVGAEWFIRFYYLPA